MKRNILVFVNKLQSYKTAIKNLHWSSKNMSEHKLWDDIADTVSNTQDEVAEIAQGLFGKIKNNELKPRRYNITNSKKTLNDIIKDTKMFYGTIKRSNDYIGLRSVVESFIADMEKYLYLMDFCLKEDIKRNMMSLNENKQSNNNKKTVKLSENELRGLIRESIMRVLNEDLDSHRKELERAASWDAFEKTRQPSDKRFGSNDTLDTYLDGKDSWYEYGEGRYDDAMEGYDENSDDFYDEYHQFAKDDDGFNGMQAQREEPRYKHYYQDRFSKPKKSLEKFI